MGVFDVEVEDDIRSTKRRRVEEGEKFDSASEPSLRAMIEIKITDTWQA